MQEGTILVCGATGNVGSAAVASLAASSRRVRALVRPGSEPRHLRSIGVELAAGDVRNPASVRRALSGISIVVCAVTAMNRYMAGDHTARIRDVDHVGVGTLVDLAEEEGVERFVYVSFPRLYAATHCPLITAGTEIERRLRQSRMTTVIVRAEPYAELWLSSSVGFDPQAGTARIFGRGNQPIRFTSTADVGAAAARLAVIEHPVNEVELAGPEAMSFLEAVDFIESLSGRRIKRRHIPRAALRAGYVVLRSVLPELASAMALGLALDSTKSTVGSGGYGALGFEPLAVSDYLRNQGSSRHVLRDRFEEPVP